MDIKNIKFQKILMIIRRLQPRLTKNNRLNDVRQNAPLINRIEVHPALCLGNMTDDPLSSFFDHIIMCNFGYGN